MKSLDLAFSTKKKSGSTGFWWKRSNAFICPLTGGMNCHAEGVPKEGCDFGTFHWLSGTEREPEIGVDFENFSSYLLFAKVCVDLYLPGKRIVHIDGEWKTCFPLYIPDDSILSYENYGVPVVEQRVSSNVMENYYLPEETILSFHVMVVKGPEMLPHFRRNEREYVLFDTNSVVERLHHFFDKNMLCDFCILSGGRQFWCHKFVLCSRSPVFQAMLSLNCQEAIDDVVDMSSTSPKTVHCLLCLIYCRDLPENTTTEELLEISDLAHKYMIKIQCGNHMSEPCKHFDNYGFTTSKVPPMFCGLTHLEMWVAYKVLTNHSARDRHCYLCPKIPLFVNLACAQQSTECLSYKCLGESVRML